MCTLDLAWCSEVDQVQKHARHTTQNDGTKMYPKSWGCRLNEVLFEVTSNDIAICYGNDRHNLIVQQFCVIWNSAKLKFTNIFFRFKRLVLWFNENEPMSRIWMKIWLKLSYIKLLLLQKMVGKSLQLLELVDIVNARVLAVATINIRSNSLYFTK